MILGTASKNPPPSLTVSNNPVERVMCFKLLGINISNDLRLMFCVQTLHHDCIFLSCLNVLDCQLMICCVCKSVILSVLEYGSVVCHHHLTHAQSDKLEALQKCAVRIIIHPLTLPCVTVLGYLKLDSLKHRRMEAGEFANLIVVSTTFFHLHATLYL